MPKHKFWLRTNGLFVVEHGAITDLDTSTEAAKAGQALAKALEKILESHTQTRNYGG